MWPRYLNVTDGRTDGRMTCRGNTALCVAYRAVTILERGKQRKNYCQIILWECCSEGHRRSLIGLHLLATLVLVVLHTYVWVSRVLPASHQVVARHSVLTSTRQSNLRPSRSLWRHTPNIAFHPPHVMLRGPPTMCPSSGRPPPA